MLIFELCIYDAPILIIQPLANANYTYRLIESLRIAGQPRQITLLNFCKHFAIYQDLWPAVCVRVEELINHQTPIFSLDTLGVILDGSGFVRSSQTFAGNIAEVGTLETMIKGLDAPWAHWW